MQKVIVYISIILNAAKCQIHSVQEGLSLIEGTDSHGIIQLNYDGRSGLLCADEGARQEVGRVACRDLSLPFEYPSIRPVPAPADAFFLGSHVTCSGDEIKLSDCQHDPWDERVPCVGRQAVYLSCQDDPCVSSPCQNGGKCETTSSEMVGYRCNCTAEWADLVCSTDVNECVVNNGGCSDTCLNLRGAYLCLCPEPHLSLAPDNHTCVAEGEEVRCLSDFMELSLDKAQFPSLHREHLTLDDPSCVARDNHTHIILRAPLTGCGTTSQQSGTSIAYKNVVHSKEEVIDGLISRVKDVQIPFQCVMTLAEVKEIPVAVDTDKLHFLLEGRGRHDVDLKFSTHGDLQPTQIPQGQISVYPGQDLHGVVTLTTVDPDLGLVLSNCSATRNLSHNSTDTPYVMLQDGCPVDNTLVIYNSTDQGSQQRFQLEAFKFLDNSLQVAVHCDVTLCDVMNDTSACSLGCGTH